MFLCQKKKSITIKKIRIMKQIIKSAIIAIVFTSGTVMLTSCEKVVVDTVDGLFKPLNDAAEEYAKERKQQNMYNLFNGESVMIPIRKPSTSMVLTTASR